MVGEEEKSRRLNNGGIYLNMKFDFTSRAGLGQAQEKIWFPRGLFLDDTASGSKSKGFYVWFSRLFITILIKISSRIAN